jgi:hypothetical protein
VHNYTFYFIIKTNLMKTNIHIPLMLLIAVLLSSCAPLGQQRGMASRDTTDEWQVYRYENRQAYGQNVVIDNAGTIRFNADGTGSQNFMTNAGLGDRQSDTRFTWTKDGQIVYIRTSDFNPTKAWIIVQGGARSQRWYSTDSQGNVQVMHLRRQQIR